MVKYAPRKVYIRESGGYVELSYTEFCRCRESDQTYMDKLFIPIQGCLLEVVREQYTDFYRDKERWRYLQKLDTKNRLLSLDGFTDSEGNPLDFITDEAVDIAETVVNAVMVDRLKAALPLLSDSEQELIQAIFFDGLSEREVGAKIVIAGHSWGTVLGMEYVNTHPEKVAAYIGVGQVTDFSQGKIHAAQIASQAASAGGNKEDSALLERHIEELSKAESIDQVNAESLEEMIIASLKLLRSDGEMSGVEQAIMGVTAPEMLWDDMRWFLFESDTKSIFDAQGKLVDYMYFRFDVAKLSSEYDIPICFIQGDSDWITPTDMVAEYYSGITAEKKEMVTIENAGHTPFLDNPGRFCKAIETFLSGCGIE